MWRKQSCASQIWMWLWSLLLQQYRNYAKGSHLFPSSVARTQRNRERQRAKVLFYSKPFLSLRAHCAIIFPFPLISDLFCVSCLALGRLRDMLTSCNSHAAWRGLCSLCAWHRLASSFEMWQRLITPTHRASTRARHAPRAKDPLQRSAASVRKQRWALCREKYISGKLLLYPQTSLTPG